MDEVDAPKVVYPTKFQNLKNKVKSALGMECEYSMWIDERTLMQAFMDSQLYGSFARNAHKTNTMSWKFENGGVKITLYHQAL